MSAARVPRSGWFCRATSEQTVPPEEKLSGLPAVWKANCWPDLGAQKLWATAETWQGEEERDVLNRENIKMSSIFLIFNHLSTHRNDSST